MSENLQNLFDQAEPGPSKAAIQMQRHRERRKRGERCFMLYCTARLLDVLVEEGFLPAPTKPQDVTEKLVNEAIYKLVNAWRKRPNIS
jgi:hypothetical protein